jgi:hypothetical protein
LELVSEVVVHSSNVHLRLVGDLANSGRLIACFGEDLAGDFNKSSPHLIALQFGRWWFHAHLNATLKQTFIFVKTIALPRWGTWNQFGTWEKRRTTEQTRLKLLPTILLHDNADFLQP